MHETKNQYTITNLQTIFGVGRTSLHNHLYKHGLYQKLQNQGHITNTKYRKYFDDTAVLTLARTFTRQSKTRRSHTKNNSVTKHDVHTLQSELRIINDKLNLIINHFDIK